MARTKDITESKNTVAVYFTSTYTVQRKEKDEKDEKQRPNVSFGCEYRLDQDLKSTDMLLAAGQRLAMSRTWLL